MIHQSNKLKADAATLMATCRAALMGAATATRHTAATVALLTAALLASCSATDGTQPVAPGTATPEGGDQPGVEITLARPHITLAAEATTTNRAQAANTRVALTHTYISLYVDLTKADGTTVTARGLYVYSNSAWTISTPIAVRGGTGKYYMRMMAQVQSNQYTTDISTCYKGLVDVEADGTFTPAAALKPFTSALSVTLKDADGKDVTTGAGYTIYATGIAKSGLSSNGYSVEWTTDASRPLYSASGRCLSTENGTLLNLMPGTVPGKWNNNGDSYTPTGTNGLTNTLLSIYKGITKVNSDTDLPEEYDAVYHLRPLNADGTVKTFTLAPGKKYTLTVVLNGRDATIAGIDEDVDFLPVGDDDKIEL